MKQNITYNMLNCDTTNGYGIQIHYTFTSFDRTEIEEFRNWCEKHISSGLVLEKMCTHGIQRTEELMVIVARTNQGKSWVLEDVRLKTDKGEE